MRTGPKEEPKYSEKNLSQWHLVHQKSHMHRPGIETGSLPEPRDGHCRLNFIRIMTTYNLSSYHEEYTSVYTTKTNWLTVCVCVCVCVEIIYPEYKNRTPE
jgi:hypothetical protein